MFRSLNRVLRGDDGGSTMLAILGLSAVTAVISVTVVTATINGLGFTSSTRAGVQARAAAEAGIDQALVALQSSCVDEFSSMSDPLFDFKIYHSLSTATPTWIEACPGDNALLVKIESTGYAQNEGVTGDDSGDVRFVEAIYNYIPAAVEVPEIGAAVYAYTISGPLKKFVLDSSSTVAADVQIKKGDAICTNNARIAGNLILGDGYADLTNCAVTGTVHASKYVKMSGNATLIGGDVIAAGAGVTPATSPTTGSDVVNLSSGAKVSGSLIAGGNITTSGGPSATVQKNVIVAGSVWSRARIQSTTVNGYLQSSGTKSGNGTIVLGSTQNVVGLTPPAAPLIPDWTDIPYTAPFSSTTWGQQGFVERIWDGPCVIVGADLKWLALASLTQKTVVNALDTCGPAGLTVGNSAAAAGPLILQTDIVFAAQTLKFEKLNVSSLLNVPRRIWLYVPDNTANGVPSPSPCPASGVGGIDMNNETNITDYVSIMAYTPCKFTSNRDGWRGQIYAGEVEFEEQATLIFSNVGMPGVSLTGAPPVPPAPAQLGNRVSFREVNTVG